MFHVEVGRTNLVSQPCYHFTPGVDIWVRLLVVFPAKLGIEIKEGLESPSTLFFRVVFISVARTFENPQPTGACGV